MNTDIKSEKNQNILENNFKTTSPDQRILTDEQITAILSEIGKEFGCEKVTAEFCHFKDFKVKWQRSYNWANLAVSDYLKTANDEAVKGLGRTIFSKMFGGKIIPYSDELVSFFTSNEFTELNQPIYIKRSRSITKTTKGDVKDLKESYERLVKLGLVPKENDIYLTWTAEPMYNKVGYLSMVMKVICMSKELDSEKITDEMLDFALYSEYVSFIESRYAIKNDDHYDANFQRTKFPNWEDVKEKFDKMSINVW